MVVEALKPDQARLLQEAGYDSLQYELRREQDSRRGSPPGDDPTIMITVHRPEPFVHHDVVAPA